VKTITAKFSPHCIQKGLGTPTGGQPLMLELVPFEHKTVFTSHTFFGAGKTGIRLAGCKWQHQ